MFTTLLLKSLSHEFPFSEESLGWKDTWEWGCNASCPWCLQPSLSGGNQCNRYHHWGDFFSSGHPISTSSHQGYPDGFPVEHPGLLGGYELAMTEALLQNHTTAEECRDGEGDSQHEGGVWVSQKITREVWGSLQEARGEDVVPGANKVETEGWPEAIPGEYHGSGEWQASSWKKNSKSMICGGQERLTRASDLVTLVQSAILTRAWLLWATRSLPLHYHGQGQVLVKCNKRSRPSGRKIINPMSIPLQERVWHQPTEQSDWGWADPGSSATKETEKKKTQVTFCPV